MTTPALLLALALAAPRVATPSFDPPGGTYSSAQTVTVRTESTGAAIYCSTAGVPARTVANRCGTGTCTIAVPATATLRCRAEAAERPDSLVASATYAINAAPAGTPPQFYAAAVSAFSAMPLRSTGQVYYFCDCKAGAQAGCVAGDDANPGTSPAAPRRRWWTALQTFNAMNAGDTVALCRGGAWSLDTAIGTCSGYADPGPTHDSGMAYVTNPRCGAGADPLAAGNASTCDVRDYQASWGGTNKPLLAIPASVTTQTMVLGRNGAATTGMRIMNLELRGANGGPRGTPLYQSFGIWQGSCGATTDTSLVLANLTVRNFRVGLHLETNSALVFGMRLLGTDFRLNNLDAILGGPGQGGKVDANLFVDNGGWYDSSGGGAAHSFYPNGVNPGGTAGAEITNNEFRYDTTAPETAIISGHAHFNGLLVENNWISCGTAPSCWAMKLDSGNRSGAGPHIQQNLVIRRNRVRTSGGGIALAQPMGTIVVENNTVEYVGSVGWRRAILIPSEDVFDWGGAWTARVRNNTIVSPFAHPNSTAIHVGWTGDAQGSGHVIANNAVVTGGSAMPCFELNSSSSAYAAITHNDCYLGSWGTTYGDPATRYTFNPLLAADLRPQPGSPLLDAGSATYGAATDYTGAARVSPPSIGAFEAP